MSSDLQERGRFRWRRIRAAAAWSAAHQFLGLGLSIVLTPFVLQLLGVEKYGLYSLIIALPALLGLADMGVGSTLVNAAAAAAAAQTEQARRELAALVANALALLTAIGAAVVLTAWALTTRVDWGGFLSLSDAVDKEAGAALLAFAVIFAVSLPASVGRKLQFGFQESWQSSIWSIGATALASVGLAGLVSQGIDRTWVVVAVAAGAPCAVSVVNTYYVLWARPWLRPRISYLSAASFQSLAAPSLMFLVMGVAGAVGYETDNIVVANALGADQVSKYALTAKLFAVPVMLTALVLTPLWPAYANAISHGDLAWVRRTFRRSWMFAFTVNVPLALLLIALGPRLLELWVGAEVRPPTALFVGFGLWTLANTIQGPLAMWMMGVGAIKFQVICAVVMAVVNITLSVTLARGIGLAGPIFGSVIAQTLCINLPTLVYFRRRTRSAGGMTGRDPERPRPAVVSVAITQDAVHDAAASAAPHAREGKP